MNTDSLPLPPSVVCECDTTERALYIVTSLDGSDALCSYCDECAALAAGNFNGETAAIRPAKFSAPKERPTPKTLVRVGLPYSSESELYRACQELNAPILISAGGLYKPERGGFQPIGVAAYGLDAALDSAGFVAMKQGGYRWTVQEYVEWVALGRASNGLGASDRGSDFDGIFPWKWWSAMDYCCEAEIATDREQVEKRIQQTIDSLDETLEAVDYMRDYEGASWLIDPMPILQGRTPADYVECAKQIENVLRANGRDGLPALVGVGSVCRRELHGPEGLLPVLEALDAALPANVRLHLFGVKGAALDHVNAARIGSIDSMAWDERCKHGTREKMIAKAKELGLDDFKALKGTEHWIKRTGAVRAVYLREWYLKQTGRGVEIPQRKTPGVLKSKGGDLLVTGYDPEPEVVETPKERHLRRQSIQFSEGERVELVEDYSGVMQSGAQFTLTGHCMVTENLGGFYLLDDDGKKWGPWNIVTIRKWCDHVEVPSGLAQGYLFGFGFPEKDVEEQFEKGRPLREPAHEIDAPIPPPDTDTDTDTDIACPCCGRRFTLDAGHFPDHNDASGDECAGANLPPWAATAEAASR